jgi:hypothetical protein
MLLLLLSLFGFSLGRFSTNIIGGIPVGSPKDYPWYIRMRIDRRKNSIFYTHSCIIFFSPSFIFFFFLNVEKWIKICTFLHVVHFFYYIPLKDDRVEPKTTRMDDDGLLVLCRDKVRSNLFYCFQSVYLFFIISFWFDRISPRFILTSAHCNVEIGDVVETVINPAFFFSAIFDVDDRSHRFPPPHFSSSFFHRVVLISEFLIALKEPRELLLKR